MAHSSGFKTTRRRHDLDALRAFAMLLGIGLHASMSLFAMPWVVQDNHQNPGFALLFLAIHGFRMPLFFVLSGFFTAMLWRNRGLRSLVRHRTRRIAIPLILGLVTVCPIVNLASNWAMQYQTSSVTEATSNLWNSAAAGDASEVQAQIERGVQINARDSVFGSTPLGWAVAHGQTEAARVLIANDANVNARFRDGSTALHTAALLGQTELCELLLAAGADTSLKDSRGLTPAGTLETDRGTTEFMINFRSVGRSWESVSSGRTQVAQILQDERFVAASDMSQPATTVTNDSLQAKPQPLLHAFSDRIDSGIQFLATSALFTTPVFHHLWFLWFLCWLIVGFVLVARLADRVGYSGPPAWLVASRFRCLWLVPLVMIPQWFMGRIGPVFGPDTSTGLLPYPHVLLYYTVFFTFGALAFDVRESTERPGRSWWVTLPFALLIVLPIGIEFSFGVTGLGDKYATEISHRLLATFFQALYAWLMTFSLMGLFRRYFSVERASVRYLSDASYWLYLAHMPIVICLQAIIRPQQQSAFTKFTWICLITTGLLVASYQLMVRYSWIGRMLNGPRHRRPKMVVPEIGMEPLP